MNDEVIGIGTDIELVERFEKLPFSENSGFYRNAFAEEEIQECLAKPNTAQSFAARFAAKEAIIKGASAAASLSFRDIVILNGKATPPNVMISTNGIRAYVSLSHTKEHAIAFALVMRGKK